MVNEKIESIYNNLESLLGPQWSVKNEVENTKENINQYFKAFSDLRYFVDRTSGEFLYELDEKGNRTGKLNYQAIYKNAPELLTLKANGTPDEEKSNKTIDEVFAKTNQYFSKLKLIEDLSNDSRLHGRFGSSGVSYNLPNADEYFLYKLKDVSSIYPVFQRYIDNALNLTKKIAPINYAQIHEVQDNTVAMNLFLTVCNIKYENNKKSSNKEFNMNNYLDEKLVNATSALDKIDAIEYEEQHFKNRSTDEFVGFLAPNKELANKYYGVNQLVDEKIFNLYATKDMKLELNKLKKKLKKK
jgi:hypothetical protein